MEMSSLEKSEKRGTLETGFNGLVREELPLPIDSWLQVSWGTFEFRRQRTEIQGLGVIVVETSMGRVCLLKLGQ